MPNFDLKILDITQGKQKIYQLTIDDNPNIEGAKDEKEINERKRGVLDEFAESLESRYKKDLRAMYTYMELVSNGCHVSGAKYHELTDRPKGDQIKDFEFKHGDLRVYAFKSDAGKIIALCGYKNAEPKNINRLRSLKQQYFKSLKK